MRKQSQPIIELTLILECLLLIVLIFFYISYFSNIFINPLKPYSSNAAFRLQTDALFNGHLALSPNPFGSPIWDYLWTENGLVQNWGMGVPFLRLPFEWAARISGLMAFPDRYVLIFYFSVMVVILNHSLKILLLSINFYPNSLKELLIRMYILTWILFSPGFIGLVQNNIDIYNEAIYYGCIFTHILLATLIIFLFKPGKRLFLTLCLLAGLIWIIRPTLIAYGLISLVLSFYYAYKNNFTPKLLMSGLACFSIGIVSQLYINYILFGHITTFANIGQLSGNPGVNFSTDFDYPFRHASLIVAFKELLGNLFFNNSWHSHLFRMRELRKSVFNLSHFILLLSSISIILIPKNKVKHAPIFKSMVLWSIVTMAILFSFYMYFLGTTWRFGCDFSTAMNAIIIILCAIILSQENCLNSWINPPIKLVIFFIITLPFYVGGNITSFQFNAINAEQSNMHYIMNKEEVLASIKSIEQVMSSKASVPNIYLCGQKYNIPIYNNLTGWSVSSNCSVRADVHLFLTNTPCITINYTISNTQPIPNLLVRRDYGFLSSSQTKIFNVRSGFKTIQQTFCSNSKSTDPYAFYKIGWLNEKDLNLRNLSIKLNWVYATKK